LLPSVLSCGLKGKIAMTSSNTTDSTTVCGAASSSPPVHGLRRERHLVAAAYCTCALIWGTTWYAIRVCIEPGGYTAYVAAALRFTIAALLLAAICLARLNKFKKPQRHEIAWISIAGLMSGLAFGGLYVAEQDVKGGIAAVISATSPLMAALIAMATRTEQPARFTITGCLVSVCGIAFLFRDRLQVSQAEAAAVGILLITSFLYACSNVVMKRHGNLVSPLAANLIFFVAASTLLWGAAAITGSCSLPWPPPASPTIALFYLSLFGTLFTFASFFYLLKRVRLSTALTLGFVTPIIALFVDAVFEKHGALALETYGGIAIVLSGLALSIFGKSARSNGNPQTAGTADLKDPEAGRQD
jgi:drug/metabolite transporter (DMT)-like permease